MSSIKLYDFTKPQNSPSISGYCQKLETLLRASSYDNYTHHPTMPRSAPKGKLPYIELTPSPTSAPETIADSHFIARHLIATKTIPDPDEGLTAARRADSRAWIGYTDDTFYPAVAHTRWARPDNYAVMRAGLPFPPVLRPIVAWYISWNITRRLWTAGMGRHSDEEIDTIIREWVEGVDARLEGVKYFYGDKPSMVDVDVYAFIVSGLECGRGNREFLDMMLGKERIREYAARLTRLWFPEYEGILEIVERK
ncbi:hypothetical protein L873DRAFT_1802728 [Choiromyces venosus 120613-1]|uniref:Thioredoxin-like fold domain-containing protein n=1 Tax=Choiromyces venosus 120613-1 TaxID=1336337 RepID=A0A3N4JU90_9PEZI|nr:hypothetical protein L873DRAFT_1802728 [Choiromyces venosus 120613-1]